jgi:3D (Asp-Asp-Asp) domain-containing protein
MKSIRSLCLFACVALVQSVAQAAQPSSSPLNDVAAGQELKVRTTAYSPTEPGGSSRSALDSRLKHGGKVYSAASDWSWLPVGTVFRMKQTGITYRIEDYGSALVGRKTIDLYVPNNRMMNSWGVKNVDIEILELGSYEKSLDILEGRMRNRHVRKMVAALRQQKSDQTLLAIAQVGSN